MKEVAQWQLDYTAAFQNHWKQQHENVLDLYAKWKDELKQQYKGR